MALNRGNNSTRRPPEREQILEFWAVERKKSAKLWVSHHSDPHPKERHHRSGPKSSAPTPPFWDSLFLGSGPAGKSKILDTFQNSQMLEFQAF